MHALTIAIPTYNRPAQLRATLETILPQVLACDQVELLLLDNHSETPVQNILGSLLKQPNNRVRVIRHPVNIGGNANIMRCFELCETDWLWVLGDDDKPADNAVETILRDAGGGHCFAYYWVPEIQKPLFGECEPEKVTGCSTEALLRRFDGNFMQLIFISAAVFNVSKIRPYLLFGYMSATSGMPHLIMAMKAMVRGERWLISRVSIADYVYPGNGNTHNVLTFAYAVPSILSCAVGRDETNAVLQIMRGKHNYLGSPFLTIYRLIEHHQFYTGGSNLRYLFNMVRQMYAPRVTDDPLGWCKWHIASVALMFPKGYVKAIRFYEKQLKKNFSSIRCDRF